MTPSNRELALLDSGEYLYLRELSEPRDNWLQLVVQVTREIGIRMALGSTVGHAMVQIGRSGAGGSVLGLVLGLALCAGVLRVMRSVVYGVGVYDVPTILGVVLVLASMTLIATTVSTLRIASIDPANTLRDELSTPGYIRIGHRTSAAPLLHFCDDRVDQAFHTS